MRNAIEDIIDEIGPDLVGRAVVVAGCFVLCLLIIWLQSCSPLPVQPATTTAHCRPASDVYLPNPLSVDEMIEQQQLREEAEAMRWSLRNGNGT